MNEHFRERIRNRYMQETWFFEDGVDEQPVPNPNVEHLWWVRSSDSEHGDWAETRWPRVTLAIVRAKTWEEVWEKMGFQPYGHQALVVLPSEVKAILKDENERIRKLQDQIDEIALVRRNILEETNYG